MLNIKQITGLLYSMGHTFDNLASTYIATEEFLTTNNPSVIGSRNDLALLQDLQEAASCMLHHDYSHGLDTDFVCAVNASMTRTAAIEPGVLRTAQNVLVRTTLGDYIPPIPQRKDIAAALEKANSSSGELIDAAELFATLAKMQPFGDGNKRTALLVANGLLIMRGRSSVLSVPVANPERSEFGKALSAWYVQGDSSVIELLATYNTGIVGLDDHGHPVKHSM